MAAAKSYENPLLGHARMRTLYRTLVEARALSKRAGKRGLPRNLEACWVGTAIDLQPGDLAHGSHLQAFGAFLRAAGLRKSDRSSTPTEFKQHAKRVAAATPFAGSPGEELCCAIGQAMALQATQPKAVVVAYAQAQALTSAEWRRILTVANLGALPLAIVTIPGQTTQVDLSATARKVPGPTIPVIEVDAGDPVALYRVMQETYIRARAEGGVVLIECVPTGTDPVTLLAEQLGSKGIVSQRWIAAVAASAQTLTESL